MLGRLRGERQGGARFTTSEKRGGRVSSRVSCMKRLAKGKKSSTSGSATWKDLTCQEGRGFENLGGGGGGQPLDAVSKEGETRKEETLHSEKKR